MASLSLLVFVLVVHFSDGRDLTVARAVEACPSAAAAAARAAAYDGAESWQAACLRMRLVPVAPGRGS